MTRELPDNSPSFLRRFGWLIFWVLFLIAMGVSTVGLLHLRTWRNATSALIPQAMVFRDRIRHLEYQGNDPRAVALALGVELKPASKWYKDNPKHEVCLAVDPVSGFQFELNFLEGELAGHRDHPRIPPFPLRYFGPIETLCRAVRDFAWPVWILLGWLFVAMVMASIRRRKRSQVVLALVIATLLAGWGLSPGQTQVVLRLPSPAEFGTSMSRQTPPAGALAALVWLQAFALRFSLRLVWFPVVAYGIALLLAPIWRRRIAHVALALAIAGLVATQVFLPPNTRLSARLLKAISTPTGGLMIPLSVGLFLGSRSLRRWTTEPICARCGYDLTGNTSGRCPECGMPIPLWLRHLLKPPVAVAGGQLEPDFEHIDDDEEKPDTEESQDPAEPSEPSEEKTD